MQVSEIKLSYNRLQLSSGKLTDSGQIHNFIREYLNLTKEDISLQEKFYAIFLDVGMNVIGVTKLAECGIDAVLVDARLLYVTALNTGAKNVIISHNHPSGNMKPSDADRTITTKMEQGLRTLDIKLLDHIILSSTEYDYYSFLDNGLI